MSVLTAQDFSSVLSGLDHPEDIVWDSETQRLYAGSENGLLYSGRLDGTWSPVARLGDGLLLLGLALDGQGRVYVCNAGGHRLEVVDPESGTAVVLSTGCAERAMITPNYPAFEPSGRLFVSDSGTWGSDNGVIYTVSASDEGYTEVWDSRLPRFTNGIALSPDREWLYVVESIASRVSRIEIRPDGKAGRLEQVWSVPQTVPDGLAFDTAGRLYISCYTPDSIYVVEPDGDTILFAHDWSGQTLQAPTNIAFVGEQLTLLATANLCGWHVNVTTKIPDAGLPVPRPVLA
ncbi:MAG: SMP-30/gluconolactonase/LRE family protein [Chloroflexi bacterium]|nr:SMP-30/gluconolactonase/LRE family protein [Chloroflexota bacterium]